MDNKTAHKAQTNSLTTVKKEGEEGGGGEEGNIQSIQQTINCNYEIQSSVKNNTILFLFMTTKCRNDMEMQL